ncbi:DNA primase [Streptomyces longwoodensis]|uniref:DNA primase n=1 Tax=Streptomyces longwoodensis TaxID=68231 RepID=UPI0037F56CDB
MNRTGLGLAVGAGYMLGRTKKLKLAIAVGSIVAGKKLKLSPKAIGDLLSQQLKDNPQFKELGDTLRQDLRGAGKAASGAMLERQLSGLADRLHGRTVQMREEMAGGGRSDDEDEAEDRDDREDDDLEPEDAEDEDHEDEGRSEDEHDEEPEDSEDEPDEEDDEDSEDGDERAETSRKPPAKKAPAKKAPAKKAPAKKAPAKKVAKKAPVKRAATQKTATKKTPARKTTAKTASRGRSGGGGDR